MPARGHKQSPQACAKISAAKLGKTHSDETRAQISSSLRGKSHPRQASFIARKNSCKSDRVTWLESLDVFGDLPTEYREQLRLVAKHSIRAVMEKCFELLAIEERKERVHEAGRQG